MGGVTGVVHLLLEAGADPAEQNGAGETALSLAVLVGHWECAEALLLSQGGARAVLVSALEGACLFCYPVSYLAGLCHAPVSLSLIEQKNSN